MSKPAVQKRHSNLSFPVVRRPAKLKVGVLIIGGQQPFWAVQMLAHISTLSFVDLVMIRPRDEIRPAAGGESRSFLWRLFSGFDRALHLRKVASDKVIEFDSSAFNVNIVSFSMLTGDGSLTIPDAGEMDVLQGLGLDLLLCFEDLALDDRLVSVARYGCCPFPARFLAWRLPEKVTQFLYRLSRGGEKSLSDDPYCSVFPPGQNWSKRTASAFQFLVLMAKVFGGKVFHRLFEGIYRERWEIAGCFSDRPLHEKGSLDISWRLRPPVKKIYGDPFPVKAGSRYHLFFEEMTVDEKNYTLTGQISTLEIDPLKGPLGKPRQVLQRGYHLSYPFIFTWKGEFYMLPETLQNRTVELYRCTDFPYSWEFCKTLLEGIAAVDVTLFEKNGLWWLFTGMPQTAPEAGLGIKLPHLYSLNLYYSETPLGEWQPHPLNPIKTDRTSVRGAGRILEYGGQVFRPAQDCTPRYGRAVVFNRIDLLTTTEYHETEDVTIQPPERWDVAGIHTFNTCGGLQVADFINFRSRFLP